MASSNQFQNLSATFQQKLQEMRHSPSAISALASLGLHGLIFLALPLLSYTAVQPEEPEIRRPVEVVELTPDEQKRLPDFSSLPPIELPSITPPPKLGSDLFSQSDLPKPSGSSVSPSFPSNDSLLTPLPIFIPPPAPITDIPTFTIPITPLPRSTAPKPAPAPSPAPQTSQSASPSPTPSPDAAPSPAPTVAVEPPPAGAESPQPQATESPQPRTQEQIQQDLVARQQELRELYTYNPSGTRQGDAQSSFAAWFYEDLKKTGDDFDRRKEEKVTLDYPKIACPLKQSRFAVVGLMVDPENKIVGEPKILQSSGYRLFNQAALDAVKDMAFENTTGDDKTAKVEQLHLVTVNFEYSEDVCPPGLAPAASTAPAG